MNKPQTLFYQLLLELFPDGISDETAAAIEQLLTDTLEAWQWLYYTQLRRFYGSHSPEPPDTFEPPDTVDF